MTAVTHRVPFVVVGLDRELRVTDWNDRAAQQFGRPTADVLGRDIAEVLPVTGGEASWRDLLVDHDDAPPRRLAFADGRTFKWTAAVARVGDDVVGVVCYGIDVTAQVAAQQAGELEHVMLRVIADNLPITICAYAPEGTYMFVDGMGLSMIGIQPAQLLGQNPLELFAGNNDAVEFIRSGLAGVASHMEIETFGRIWDSWHIPAPAGNRAALVSLSLDVTEARRREQELTSKLELIERQRQVIRELSTPIIEVWEGIVVMPIIGLVDSVRTAEIMENLLASVGRLRARFAILDMTGIDVVDTATANHLLGMIRAVRLLGAEGIITGIQPGVAQTIVTLGVDLAHIVMHANLRQALKHCLAVAARTSARGPAPRDS